jgi:hypothetical protein
MGDLGDELALGSVEGGLAVPEQENDVDSRQDRNQQNQSLDQNQPVDPAGQQLGAVFFRKGSQFAVAPHEPIDPADHDQDPDQLDADECEKGIDEPPEDFHVLSLSSNS